MNLESDSFGRRQIRSQKEKWSLENLQYWRQFSAAKPLLAARKFLIRPIL